MLNYKSLSEENFKRPKHDDKVITLTGQQINWLLNGYDISAMKGHEKFALRGSLLSYLIR